MKFEPIAIVGRSCVLPGALTPAEYGALLLEGRCVTGPAPPGYWNVDPETVLVGDADVPPPNTTRSDQGGYVSGFEGVFEPDRYDVGPYDIAALDPLFHWLLHCGDAALHDAGVESANAAARKRTDLLIANLCFPSHSLVSLADSTLLDMQASDYLSGTADTPASLAGITRPHAINRFGAGLSSALVARGLGVGGETYALDAACASSIYGIKLACDRLHAGEADLAVVLGSNRVDDLFLRMGFTTIMAMSREGVLRPFDLNADGMVPAEGVAGVALKRMDDAAREGNRIFGVISGLGLSNDGRGKGLLVPAAEGQERALTQAYRESGWRPEDVSLLEGHATGTPIGDVTEVEMLAKVFCDARDLPIGSHKSNIGHLMTGSGMAGLLKLLCALESGKRPPTLNVREPLSEIEATPLRLVETVEDWPSDSPRRAALNSFGFGGNNAHLLVEEWTADRSLSATSVALPAGIDTSQQEASAQHPADKDLAEPQAAPANEPIAIVAVEVIAADGDGLGDFLRCLLADRSRVRTRDDGERGAFAEFIQLPLGKIRFAPNDLADTLSQQTMVLQAVWQLQHGEPQLPRERTGVYVGMQCDAYPARMSGAARVESWARRWAAAKGGSVDEEWLEKARIAIEPRPTTPAGAMGALPNVVANRICSQFDIGGPSFTIQADEHSGLIALETGARALRRGELDLSIVAAVDLCCEPINRAAAEQVLPADKRVPGDAAVALRLKRLSDARRDGDAVFAILSDRPEAQPVLQLGDSTGLRALFGHAHAASGLLEVAVGALACRHHMTPLAALGKGKGAAAWPTDAGPAATVEVTTPNLLGMTRSVWLQSDPEAEPSPLIAERVPELTAYRAKSANALFDDLVAAAECSDGPVCLAIVARDASQREQRLELARRVVSQRPDACGELAPGVYFRQAPLAGDLAAVFTGAAAAYPGMGQALLAALPGTVEATRTGSQSAARALESLQARGYGRSASPEEKLWASSLLTQLHFRVSRDLLGLRPSAAIGMSSGESNALFAFGAWQDLDAMSQDLSAAQTFTHEMGGDFALLAGAADGASPPAHDEKRWSSIRLLVDRDAALELIGDESQVHLSIINAPGDVVISGDAEACSRVVAKLPRHRYHQLDYDLVVHSPEFAPYADRYRELHHRETHDVPGVRFYSAYLGRHYELNADSVADALTGLGGHQLDFPRLIEQAYEDGVRVFVEHGPRDACTQWISRILGDRAHLAVSLDGTRGDLEQLVHAAAQLTAAGVPGDYAGLDAELRALVPPLGGVDESSMLRSYLAHTQRVRLPPFVLATGDTGASAHDPAEEFEHVSELEGETMEVAPSLDEQLTRHSGLVAEHRVEVPPTAMTAAATAAPAAATPAAAAATPAGNRPSAGLAHVAALAHQRTASIHQQFLERQGALQQHYLAQVMTTQAAIQSLRPPSQAAAPAVLPPAPVQPETLAAQPPALEQPAPPPVPSVPTAPDAANEVAAGGPAPEADTGIVPAGTAEVIGEIHPSPNLGARWSFMRRRPCGPAYNREELEIMACDKISRVWGPLFEQQDDYERQVRMPMPPLLLADRVTGIEGEPAVIGPGSIWTETDINWDSWFTQEGFMPMGVMVESGQADLLLISWQGIDFQNKSDRIYRLVGCEICYDGKIPRPGDVLRFDIRITAHTSLGGVHLFFFEYDGHVNGERVLAVRSGQAGLFSDAELASSGGVLWDPSDTELDPDARVDPPLVKCTRNRFDPEQVRAFSEDRVYDCFGPGFEPTKNHIRSPHIPSGKLLLVDEVTHFEPNGGPWGRGYLRATRDVNPDDWFFPAHFKNDPCMPGTLMCEGAQQAMAMFLTGLGFTLDRDGWLIAPVPHHSSKLRCRGQVTPTSKQLVYEVFVLEVHGGETPTVWAEILGSCDGMKVFHAERLGLQLIPDWPITSQRALVEKVDPDAEAVASRDGFSYGIASLLACALGDPANSGVLDSERTRQRMPHVAAPPYLFLSRVTSIEADPGVLRVGSAVTTEFDIDPQAWFLADSGSGQLPLCAHLEASLQSCAWTSLFLAVGDADGFEGDRQLRNLGGEMILQREVGADAGSLQTRVSLAEISHAGDTPRITFEVETTAGDEITSSMTASFGFAETSEADLALPTARDAPARLREPSDFSLDLASRPERYFGGSLRLDGPMLTMLDHVTGYWPEGGPAGRGRLRATKQIKRGDWFLKTQLGDPVQPGSLALEAMNQLLKFWMIENELGDGLDMPRFAGLPERSIRWQCAGQASADAGEIAVEFNVLESGRDAEGPYAVAEAWLWADDQCLYHVENLALRVASDRSAPQVCNSRAKPIEFDRAQASWLFDHRPTGGAPALPMMAALDCLAQTALEQTEARYPREGEGSWHVTSIDQIEMERWIWLDDEVDLRCHSRLHAAKASESRVDHATVVATLEEQRPGSAWRTSARARVGLAWVYPSPPGAKPPCAESEPIDVYAHEGIHYGAELRLLEDVRRAAAGATASVPAGASARQAGGLDPAALEAALQCALYSDLAPDETVALAEIPTLRLVSAAFFQPTASSNGSPNGAGTAAALRCELRESDVEDDEEPGRCYTLQLLDSSDLLWAELKLAPRASAQSTPTDP